MSRNLGRDVPDLEKLYARKLGLIFRTLQRLRKNQSRLNFSISLENFNQSLEIFNLDLQNSPQRKGVWWVARLQFSISLENFKILNFFNLWALRGGSGSRKSHINLSGVREPPQF